MKIRIEKYKIECLIGVHPHERVAHQVLELDVTLDVEFRGRDVLEDTVDYEAVAKSCSAVAQQKSYYLMETLAIDLLQMLCERFAVEKAVVRLYKKGAIALADSVSIEMEKTK